MKPWIVGIDPSSNKIAIVAKSPKGKTSVKGYQLAPKGRYTPARAASAQDALMVWMDEHSGIMHAGGALAYLEQPVVGKGGADASLVQAYVSGVIQACLQLAGIQVRMVHPSTWKAAVVGYPGASKDDVRSRVAQLWRPVARSCGTDQDLVDAAAICLYGQLMQRRASRLQSR